ncbi:class I SAM-dependent methyltransferase [Synechococcus sp. CCY9201]|uniref:class I SAM-dependent methyltransferase n=1 Tax=Synechococcus sp. CCY9201 TaxID=174697 RepID=UPI002B212649|nr:class I SAM-dependent methyltransferase [Synechococcus sp. CCY9201]MEA5474467.1 class I SAM-dependent methyltransferase [Synechococcus sp. CCY9201]
MTAVQTFYERHPYPAPPKDLDRLVELYRDPLRRRVMFRLLWPTLPYRASRTILVAGCGTSQAAAIALREPDATVVGIDISEASLCHTRLLQQKHGITNLKLHQLPIEQIGELNQRFDQIICTGVLHHLPDPDQGLKALRDVLKPQGAMQLMVYALYGRSGLYMLQDYCRLLDIGSSDQDLKALSATLQRLPPQHPLANVMRATKDFLHPDALADALLHPQDRAYSVPQLHAWLDRCGMAFGRWMEQAPYLPQCGVVAQTPHAAQLGALPSPSQHAAVELFRGTITKHYFTAFRQEDAAINRPDPLAPQDRSRRGDGWRCLIPLRIPWTLKVRERLPAGATAILLNQAHTCSDLILPIDSDQASLLGAIDGERTLGEIVQTAKMASGEKRALRFFRRLWQYDQIVFDGSPSKDAPN